MKLLLLILFTSAMILNQSFCKSGGGKIYSARINFQDTLDTLRLSRILHLISLQEDSVDAREFKTINDTIKTKSPVNEPTVYEATFNKENQLIYLWKHEYVDTAKDIQFHYYKDSVVMIYYIGMLLNDHSHHWVNMYLLENDKVIFEDSLNVKNIDLKGEIIDAYNRRDFFYKKLNEIK